jgi:curved DNA-binding protein CbpA
MAMLLRWLHPDLDGHGERAVFASRVTRAWDNLKNKERRAVYDQLRRSAKADDVGVRRKAGPRSHRRKSNGRQADGRRHGKLGFGQDRRQSSAHFNPQKREGLLRRILVALLGRAAF